MLDRSHLLSRFLRYIACDSESGDERSFCELLQAELRQMGFCVSTDNAGELCSSNGRNIYATLAGVGEPLLFCAHMDTVKPGKNIKPIVEKGRVRSSGDTILGADDKCGVAAIMEAMEQICADASAHRPIELLFTICEETGLCGSRNADYSRLSARQAVVFDSGYVSRVINRTPAEIKLHIGFSGKASHAASAPEQGINALKAAARAVTEIPCGHVDENSAVNIANFISAGETNIVPDKASFELELRSFTQDGLEYWEKQIRAVLDNICTESGAGCSVEKEECHGAVYVPENSPLFDLLRDAYRKMNTEPEIRRGFGCSDAAWLFANGIAAVNIGAGMRNLHSTDEWLSIDDMEQAARLILQLVKA